MLTPYVFRRDASFAFIFYGGAGYHLKVANPDFTPGCCHPFNCPCVRSLPRCGIDRKYIFCLMTQREPYSRSSVEVAGDIYSDIFKVEVALYAKS